MELTPLVLDTTAFKIGESSGERAPILHASDIYSDYYRESEPDRYARPGAPPPLLLETGLAVENILEEWLARRFANGDTHEQIVRPGELIHEGVFEDRPYKIAYNADLFIFNGRLRVGEIKATWLSSHVDPDWIKDPESWAEHAEDIRDAFMEPKFAKYWTQMKFYMKFVGTTFGRLYPFFIAGNYERPYQSQLVPVDVEFSQDEIDMEYSMLMYHALSKNMI